MCTGAADASFAPGGFSWAAAPGGEFIVDLDFSLIDRRTLVMGSHGRYARPELLSLLIDRMPTAHVQASGTDRTHR